jgi:ribosomal protein L11 methyltransferase
MADEADAARAVDRLRASGCIAVMRPSSGPRLERWRDDTRPVVVDDRLSVCVAWSEHDRSDLPGLVELGLGGFGNGSHPTTRMLLDVLLDRLQGGERVLDVGCGSGVLGLAALQLGATSFVGVDIKPEALTATHANAALNGVASRVVTSSTMDDLEEPFDIVLANVGRGPIVALAPQLVRLLCPGGWLAIGGFPPNQSDQIGAFLAPLEATDVRVVGDWATLVLSR